MQQRGKEARETPLQRIYSIKRVRARRKKSRVHESCRGEMKGETTAAAVYVHLGGGNEDCLARRTGMRNLCSFRLQKAASAAAAAGN